MTKQCDIVRRWIQAINQADLVALGQLMSEDHTFYVEGELPAQGKTKMLKAWQGYFSAFAEYCIYIDAMEQRGNDIFISAHTTGSHVNDEAEQQPGCIVLHAQIVEHTIAKWIVYPVHETWTLTWYEWAAKNRVAHSTRKQLLLAIVDDESDVSYWEVRWTRP